MPRPSVPSSVPVSSTVPDILDSLDSELMGEDLDSLLDEQEPAEVNKKICLSLHTRKLTFVTDNGVKVDWLVVEDY